MDRNGNRNVLAQGKYLRLMAGQGWEWVERLNTSGAAVIVAVTTEQELVLVEQYRVPLDVRVIELPAGLAGDGPDTADEAMIDAARRELFEETGCESSNWQVLLDGPSSAGLTTESYTLFLARDANRVGPGTGDDHEDIKVHLVPIAEIEAWLDARRREGALVDPKIYIGLYFAAKGDE